MDKLLFLYYGIKIKMLLFIIAIYLVYEKAMMKRYYKKLEKEIMYGNCKPLGIIRMTKEQVEDSEVIKECILEEGMNKAFRSMV